MNNLKELLPYIIIVITVIVIRTYFYTPVLVNGDSMKPTLTDKQLLLLNKYDKSLKRFDIVVLTRENNEKLIKRVIGLPGEYVEYKNGKLYIDGKIVKDNFSKFTNDFFLEAIDLNLKKIPDNQYLVLGDNRNNSIDSRTIGLIEKKNISGKIVYSIWPFKKIKNA